MKNYGIEFDKNGNQTNFLGYYTEETCKEMLNKIKKKK